MRRRPILVFRFRRNTGDNDNHEQERQEATRTIEKHGKGSRQEDEEKGIEHAREEGGRRRGGGEEKAGCSACMCGPAWNSEKAGGCDGSR
eukprot:765308-Hanusia_phi.AAC.10